MIKPTASESIGFGILRAGAATFVLRQKIWSRMLELQSAEFDIIIERNIRVPISDDISLETVIYHPITDVPRPAILVRTADKRADATKLFEAFFARRFAERGYHVVIQTVHGYDLSVGKFILYQHEIDDAVTLKWIVAQTWSDGQIASWGEAISAIRAKRPKPTKRLKTETERQWFL